jgi:hypothetical protein
MCDRIVIERLQFKESENIEIDEGIDNSTAMTPEKSSHLA